MFARLRVCAHLLTKHQLGGKCVRFCVCDLRVCVCHNTYINAQCSSFLWSLYCRSSLTCWIVQILCGGYFLTVHRQRLRCRQTNKHEPNPCALWVHRTNPTDAPEDKLLKQKLRQASQKSTKLACRPAMREERAWDLSRVDDITRGDLAVLCTDLFLLCEAAGWVSDQSSFSESVVEKVFVKECCRM